MKILTTGYELSTAITNLLIFITSIILILNIKKKPFRWFYYFICIDSFLGVIVHGIKMSSLINEIGEELRKYVNGTLLVASMVFIGDFA